MKKFYLASILFFVAFNLQAQLECVYTFSGNAERQGVFGNEAADYNTATLTTDRFGNANSAYSFSGALSDVITYPVRNFESMNNDSFTVASWVKRSNNGVKHTIIGNYQSALCGDNREFLLAVQADDSLIIAVYEAGTLPGYYSQKFGSITDTMWHHVVATYEIVGGAASFTFYIDGVAQSPGTYSANPKSGWNGITGGIARTGIGNWGQVGAGPCGSNGYSMNGAIDDIYYFSKVLTPTEVMNLYNLPDMNHSHVRYVDLNATGLGTGESWANAFTKLEDALGFAVEGDSIFVRQGLYKNGTIGFNLQDNDVTIFGGFGPGQTLATRDWKNHKTILDGDVNDNDIFPSNSTNLSSINDNATTVLKISASRAIVDGLTLTGGKGNLIYSKDHGTNVTDITVRNCELMESSALSYAYGVGIWVSESNSLTHTFTVENCSFHDLYGRYAVPFQFSSANNTVVNINFVNNLVYQNSSTNLANTGFNSGAGGSFAAFDNATLNAKVINSTFTKNTNVATNNTANNSLIMLGQAKNTTAEVNLESYNSIYWGNTSTRTFENFNTTSYEKAENLMMVSNITADVLTSANSVVFSQTGASQTDPLFTNSAMNDFTLTNPSPAINIGTATGLSGLIPALDIAGNTRMIGIAIDLGAFENQTVTSITKIGGANAIKIYPNPTKDILYIDANELNIEAIEIYSLEGKVLKTQFASDSFISVNELPQGLYILKVKTSTDTLVSKFVVNK